MDIIKLKFRQIDLRQYILWGFLGTLIIFFSYFVPYFLTYGNLTNIILHSSIVGIMAIGMTFIIITAGIDLSVGSLAALVGMFAARAALNPEAGIIIPLLISSGAGLLIGVFWNGLLIQFGKVTPFIVTLAGMSAFRGLALIYTDASPIFGLNQRFLDFGTGSLFGIPYPAYIVIICFIIAHIWQEKSVVARYMYAVGDNLEAAKYSGVPVSKVVLIIYGLNGLLVGFAGAILVARIGGGEPQMAVGYELDVIAAVVMGGTSLFGGKGTVLGTLVGVLILGVLSNGLNLMGYPVYYRQVVTGIIIVVAVFIDRLRVSY